MAKEIPLTRGKVAIVDDDWYEMLSLVKRHLCNGYAARRDDVSGRNCLMHRLILGAGREAHVDHINGDRLDNRASNLRLCTFAQNQQNKGAIGGYSEYKGVCWHKVRQKWVAAIRIDDKQRHLGCFESERDAAEAYNKACSIHHGEFARLNIINNELTKGKHNA